MGDLDTLTLSLSVGGSPLQPVLSSSASTSSSATSSIVPSTPSSAPLGRRLRLMGRQRRDRAENLPSTFKADESTEELKGAFSVKLVSSDDLSSFWSLTPPFLSVVSVLAGNDYSSSLDLRGALENVSKRGTFRKGTQKWGRLERCAAYAKELQLEMEAVSSASMEPVENESVFLSDLIAEEKRRKVFEKFLFPLLEGEQRE